MLSKCKKFYPIEIITLVYVLLTALYIVAFWGSIRENAAATLLCMRLAMIGVMAGLYVWNQCGSRQTLTTLRNVLPLAFIIYFYPETYYLNQCIFSHCLDETVIHIDRQLFGCSLSTLFSEAAPYAWFNELMNFAYLSYFFTILAVILYLLFYNKDKAYRSAFILLCSFFIYYILFILFPTEGPQFYEFNYHEALPALGPMRKLLLFFHSIGERPTGAVPCSHVGIMVIYMCLLWQYGRRLFWWILPLSVLLALSTVYIRAHYAVDVLLGLASAPLIYCLSCWCWKKLNLS
ncbi:MAG: phosphatase PAP2 family protein [Prevotellaceae bacterium]|jgi:membrane-associated phospholipid phosphatase|nr:phosphatase PAP2 family protein [Prevotellaceae bacterium]